MFTFHISDELELRILENRHAEEVWSLVSLNREYLALWLPWVNHSIYIEHTQQYIQAELERFAKNSGFSCGIFYNQNIVGCIGVHEIDWRNKKTSIGYWIGEAYQGKGIMTNACRSMITYLFNQLRLNRVEIRACTANLKSRAIPERLGLKHEGTIRHAELIYDRYYDHEVYGVIAEEWTN
ncbi:N-acetyltransferase [Paenibacillus psychroresistens]|uniref:N-acetyltransferase n=1 Tax=Paenibacillus psychroresistens TaxID=1778678 RepID=A0A6B8RUX2_9BACL|nr:GNAT family protein [Paenibacillus psychroresistens]QGQ99435.1 N-acetyltransferase [Paenibacillus psychroresistens]